MKIKTETPNEKTTLLRCGHAFVRIAKLVRGRYTTHRLTWKVGKRGFRKAYNNETEAYVEAERVVKHLATADGSATTLSGGDITYFNECKLRLGATPMHVAVDFYLKFHEHTVKNPKTFSEVWGLLVERRQGKNLSERYYATLRYHRKAWESCFGGRFIDTIAGDEYLKFLRESKYQDRTKLNLFRSLTSLLRFARKQRFISEDKAEIDADFGGIKNTTPEIYTPDELCRLFIAHEPNYLPYLALMAFGGSRRAEAQRLTKDSILFEDQMIRMSPEITKTSTGRTLDIPSNLVAWLKEFGAGDGPLLDRAKVPTLPAERLKECGVGTKQNALRHSFCSYHLALHRNAAMTSEIAGNSPQMLNKHYKALVSKTAAEQWFAITPERVRSFAADNSLDGLIKW
jgi:integrase